MTKTVEMLLNEGKAALTMFDNPPLEAQILLAHVLKCDRMKLYGWPEKVVSDEETTLFEELVKRRQTHEPIAYLTGTKEFWSLIFHVTHDTLIPRFDTELLVEKVLHHLPETPLSVLDLGTGCGAIACALAHTRPNWKITATDVSAKALIVAKQNAERHHLPQIEFIESDWFKALGNRRFDAIVSNPPYIREYDLHLMHGALPFEPRISLTPGPSGLEAFRLIVATSLDHLNPQGLLAFEHGYDQANAVTQILDQAGLTDIKTYYDLAGLARVTLGWRGSPSR
ncbi:MAG: peptide chain release factor N(5)-glutamine methyltransferase [Candidatus Berkiellales bacterium]